MPRWKSTSSETGICEEMEQVFTRMTQAEKVSHWDDESGDWRGLDPQEERYRAIAGRVEPGFAVLDVGCGAGLLYGYLPAVRYVGIEPSALAVRSAAGRKVPGVCHCTAEEFWPTIGRYDVVIFNESLYYCLNPRQMLTRYWGALTYSGLLILSIYQKHDSLISRVKSRLRGRYTNSRCAKEALRWIARNRLRIVSDEMVGTSRLLVVSR